MDKYWVNNRTDTNPNNNHEVHKEGCKHLPLNDGTDLGEFEDCESAIEKAEENYDNVDGCADCIPDCHNE
jgi:hypothetical protein